MKFWLRKKDRGVLSLVAVTFVWAALTIFPRYLSESFGLFQQVYLRLFTAFLFALVFFNRNLKLEKLRKIKKKEWFLLIARSLSYYLFGILLFTQAILITKINNVAFIGAIPMTAVLGWLLMREKLTPKKLGLVSLSFLGVVIISVQDYSSIFVWGRGELLTLISVLFFSFAYVTRKWHSKLLNDKEITTMLFLIGSVAVFLVSLMIGESIPTGNWKFSSVGFLMAAGIFNVAAALLVNYGFSKVEAIMASNITALEPIPASLLAMFLFSEMPTQKEIVGGLLIITAAILMNKLQTVKAT